MFEIPTFSLFYIPEAWERYPFQANPPHIGWLYGVSCLKGCREDGTDTDQMLVPDLVY